MIDLSDAERVKEIDARIQHMSKLYLQWAQSAKLRYRGLNIATITFSAAVPVIVLLAPLIGADPKSPWVASIAGILGACATLNKSLDLLFKNHDTWLRNNDSYGKLRSEQFLFQERAGMYKGLSLTDRISLYAERVEAVIGTETTSWTGTEKAPQGTAN